jgi:hypothetical protein
MMNSIIIAGSILLYTTAFILGFIIGRSTRTIAEKSSVDFEPKRMFPKSEREQRKVVSIDEKKFVTSISTDTLQKKGKELGIQHTVEDDVGVAVSKLTQLKKK